MKSSPTLIRIKSLFKELIVRESYFTFSGIDYNYKDVIAICPNAVKDYVGGIHYGASLGLEMKVEYSGTIKNLSISRQTQWKHKAEKLDEMQLAINYLMQKTFDTRLKRYIDFMEDNGFFTLGDWNFYNNGITKLGKKEYNIKNNPDKLKNMGMSNFWNIDLMEFLLYHYFSIEVFPLNISGMIFYISK